MNFVLRIASNFNFILFSFQYLLHCERRNKNYQDYSANVFVFWTRVEKPCFIVEFVFRSLSFSSLFNLATSEWTLHVGQSSHLTVLYIVLCRFFFYAFSWEKKKTPESTFVTSMYFFCAADVSLVLNDDFKNKVLCAIANRFWIYSRFEYILPAFALHHLNATKCFCLNKISVIAVTNPCNGVQRTANYIPFAGSVSSLALSLSLPLSFCMCLYVRTC